MSDDKHYALSRVEIQEVVLPGSGPVDIEVEKLIDADMTEAEAIALAGRENRRLAGTYRIREQ